jgi:excinuclease UvrABC ATPase subunit
MAKTTGALRDRVCVRCSAITHMTRSRTDTCRACTDELRQELLAAEERKLLEQIYTNVTGPEIDKNRHRTWSFVHRECGTKQTWVYGNITKRLQEDPDIIPCSSCGGKRRAANATAGFVAKYGITPEQLVELDRYTKKVRGLTDRTYKLHEAEINPLGLKRGQTEDDYHLDHIIPIRKGFGSRIATRIYSTQREFADAHLV